MKKISLNPEHLRVESFRVDVDGSGGKGTVQAHRAGDGGDAFFVTNAASGCNTCAATCLTLVCVC
jgi:hypothetical protein